MKATPAVRVLMAPPPERFTANWERAPATSVSVPKLVVPLTPLMSERPLFVMLPLASGMPAVGRTAIPDQVILPGQIVDTADTVIVIVVDVTVAALESNARFVWFWPVQPPLPLLSATATVTATDVRNSKPLGAFRMIVPIPMSPTALEPSVRTGPVRVVKVPPVVSAEIALPPVTAVTATVAEASLGSSKETINRTNAISLHFTGKMPQPLGQLVN